MSRELRHQLSLALNLVLVVVVFVLMRHLERSPSPAVPKDHPGRTAPETSPITQAPILTNAPNLPRYPESAPAADRLRWLVDQLRAAGVPNSMLARVVMADCEEQWDKRLEECHGESSKIVALQHQKERDEETEMRLVLGEEGFKLWDQAKMLREANIGKIQLTASEADSIYDLKKKLQQRRWELEEAGLNGEMDDAEMNDANDKAYSEFGQQMKSLLGDARYAASQGFGDENAAANLRQDLAAVSPSDSQLADLLKAQRQLDERLSELDKQFQDDPSSADYAVQIKALEAVHDQEYQRVLGTNVFDGLQKDQDIGYSKMKKYENVWALDDTKVDYVYGTMKYYEKSVQDYQAQARALESQGQSVDWNAVNQNLQQFAQQTQQSIQNYLGQDSYSKMQRNGIFQFNQPIQRGQIK